MQHLEFVEFAADNQSMQRAPEIVCSYRSHATRSDALSPKNESEKEAKKRDLNFEGVRDEVVEIFRHPYSLNSLNKSVSISGSTTKDSNGRSRASLSVSGSKKVNGVKVSGSISNTTTTTQSGNTNTSTTARVTITFP